MKNRKRNRLKGYDYSKNNLYFVTICVKNNLCCLGKVIRVGTGRDLSVHHPDNHHPENHPAENHHPENHHPENHLAENHHAANHPANQNYIMQLNEFGLIVEERILWLEQQYPYVEIHNHQVMPNHFHLILEIDSLKVKDLELKIKSLSSLIGAMKTTSSKLIHDTNFNDFAWHRSFHDHIIKNEQSYGNIYNYISNNPVNWYKDCFYKKG
jgi:REP element-mobilizing transposase RayT